MQKELNLMGIAMRSMTCEQNDALMKLHKWKVGALFMAAGTGKTRVSLELINGSGCSRCLWVGPLRTLDTIRDEMTKWGGLNVPLRMVGVESISMSDRIYLDVMEWVDGHPGLFMIVDESIKIKNADAVRTKRVIELGRKAEYKLILNGTPLTKNLLDLWPQMQFLSPKIIDMSINQFKDTFCNWEELIIRRGRKIERRERITGYENIDYLYWLIRNYVFEAELDLRIGRYYHYMPYMIGDSERAEYEFIKDYFLSSDGLDKWNNNIFMAMTQKMQMSYSCCRSKVDAVRRLFANGLDERKTIIFCKFVASRELCEREFPDCRVLSYQKDAFGLNLQRYNNTIYFDKMFDYAVKIQAGCRTFRKGQEYDCNYYELTGNVKLEDLIDRNINQKMNMSEYFKGKTKQEIINEL